jgi:Family of unknown function (DUF6065)
MREWMDQTNLRYAYRCLPLNIANAYGWEILCSSGFVASWNGKDDLSAISIISDSGAPVPAVSHFGHGILTFHILYVFRTAPGFDLMVQGPINRPKDGIAALTGVVETDWSPYSFTMNWLFTRAETPVWFARDEPICHIFPVRRRDIEAVEPEIRALSSAPDLQAQHELWVENRRAFNHDLKRPGSDPRGWQKFYQHGVAPGSDHVQTKDHRTRVRIRSFVDKTKKHG